MDMSRLSDDVRRDWDALRPDDVIFLLAVKGTDEADSMTSKKANATLVEKYGIKALRTAEVIQILDKDGRVIRGEGMNSRGMNNQRRRIHVKLDPVMYKVSCCSSTYNAVTNCVQQDEESTKGGKPDIYESINVIVRRKGRVCNPSVIF